MPVSTLVATAGSASANAYCTLAFANQYHIDRSPAAAAWTAAGTAAKTAAILWATLLMDRLWHWNGYTTDDTQALLWPRTGMLALNERQYIDFHAVPIELQQAVAEFAGSLVLVDRVADSDIQTQGITSLAAGPVRLTFKDAVYAKNVPDIVVNLIPPSWGCPRSSSGGVRQLQRA